MTHTPPHKTEIARRLNRAAFKAVETLPPHLRQHAGADILRGVERSLAQGMTVTLNKNVLCRMADIFEGGLGLLSEWSAVEWDDALYVALREARDALELCED